MGYEVNYKDVRIRKNALGILLSRQDDPTGRNDHTKENDRDHTIRYDAEILFPLRTKQKTSISIHEDKSDLTEHFREKKSLRRHLPRPCQNIH